MRRDSAGSPEEDGERVHQRVIDALAVLLSKRSVDAITMPQIAAAAGLSRTTIHPLFPDKQAVVAAFVAHETRRHLDGLRAGLAGVDEPVDRLRVYLRHRLEAGQQTHLGTSRPRPAPDLDQVLRDLLAEGVATGDFRIDDATTTISLVHACLSPRDLDPDAVERFVLRAVGARVDGP